MKEKEENLATALAYSAMNWHVLPTHFIHNGKCSCKKAECRSPGKHPMGHLVPKGLDGASIDVDVITKWWALCPYANISIRTGKVSNLFVLDVDVKSGGLDSLDKMESDGLYLPETFVLTGSGGYHYYYDYPEDKEVVENAVGILPGVDIRADRGYVVAPPSNHISGGIYTWGI